MRKVLIILGLILNIVVVVLILNLLGLPNNIGSDCGMGWILLIVSFDFLPTLVVVSVISLMVLLASKKKILNNILKGILIIITFVELSYVVVRIQVTSSDYECPELMLINYDEVL